MATWADPIGATRKEKELSLGSTLLHGPYLHVMGRDGRKEPRLKASVLCCCVRSRRTARRRGRRGMLPPCLPLLRESDPMGAAAKKDAATAGSLLCCVYM